MILKRNNILMLLIYSGMLIGCREVPVPKPRGYFRIDLPERKYTSFRGSSKELQDLLPLSFEYPVYGEISSGSDYKYEPGWFNIDFPFYKATIHLTYKDVRNDLEELIEQSYRMNVKNHISKADAINEEIFENPDKGVYGILYDLKGNTATALQFFVTDSVKHFLRGSLYFSAEPNADSLAPLIDFFRKDILHLIETLEWKQN